MNELKGIHHVTAITSSAEKNYDFFTNVLGMQEGAIDQSLAQATNATKKIGQLAAGGQQVQSAVSQLNAGQLKLVDGAKQVESGPQQLASGQQTCNEKLGQYTAGVHKAGTGGAHLADGANQL
jgi:putative membrane protein